MGRRKRQPATGQPQTLLGLHRAHGDAHHYPFVPLPPLGLRFFHDLGRQDKPVFLSEFGIGPVQDVIRDWRYFQQIGINERNDVGFPGTAQAFIADWARLGLTTSIRSPRTSCARASAWRPGIAP